MPTRRGMLATLGAGFVSVLTSPASALATSGAQGAAGQQQAAGSVRTTMSGPMNDNAYRVVELPPKPDAGPSMTPAARDELEHHLHCQCGCTLDVYTCRTTDFTCAISPAMHQDIMRLVQGGYTAAEIMAAFRTAYGERVLMVPVREGFNWAGYITPFVAVGVGAAVAATLMWRWRRAAAQHSTGSPPAFVAPAGVEATPEELARLDAAIRDDR